MLSSATAAQLPAYEALRVLQQGSQAAVQPLRGLPGVAAAVPTLSVDLASGRVATSSQPALGAAAEEVLALAGVFRFKAGAVVALVTGAEQVAVMFGLPVFRVTKTRLLKPHGAHFDSGEARLLALLEDALDPVGSGRGIFYSPGGDLTLAAQARAAAVTEAKTASLPPCQRADRRFWWNRQLAQPVVEAGGSAFVPTMIQGFVAQLASLPVSGDAGRTYSLDVTLVARRSADRSGTRHWRRGVDMQGAAANFVESEQLVTLDGGRVLASYVQVRGSVPLLWTQLPNIKYKPPTKILDGPATSAAFDAHMDDLVVRYGSVTCINLVNQHGSEGQLEQRFAAEARRYSSSYSAPLHYVAFDFHKQCGATNYGRLSILYDAVAADVSSGGCFQQEAGVIASRQGGVMRVNCVDCLDRTNVVQAMLARKALEALLQQPSIDVLQPGQLLTNLPEVERPYKIMWADHGDAISCQYAGTGALKSGFTRTGKRTVGGLLDDGVKSMGRYYLNNFQDGAKQDALDLLSGAYVLKPGVKLIFTRNYSPAVPLLLAGLSMVHSARCLGRSLRGELAEGGAASQALLLHVVAPLVLATGLVLLVIRFGRQLVERPQLCPNLANTLAAAAAVGSTNGSKKQA